MAYKLRNRQYFSAEVNGVTYSFTCYKQSTSYGYREICTEGYNNTETCAYIKRDIIAKASYYNRSWQRFDYETVLNRGIEVVAPDKETEQALKDILIERKAQADHERCEKEIQAFQALYEKTSPQFKERMANSDIIMQNDSDMRAVKGLMLLDMLMNN